MNAIAWLDFELADLDTAVQPFGITPRDFTRLQLLVVD